MVLTGWSLIFNKPKPAIQKTDLDPRHVRSVMEPICLVLVNLQHSVFTYKHCFLLAPNQRRVNLNLNHSEDNRQSACVHIHLKLLPHKLTNQRRRFRLFYVIVHVRYAQRVVERPADSGYQLRDEQDHLGRVVAHVHLALR